MQHLEPRNAERFGIPADPLDPIQVVLHGYRPAAGVGAHPLDRDRSGACADVPQQLTRPRHQASQRRGAKITLGQLPVMIKNLVRQSWRERGRTGLGPTQVTQITLSAGAGPAQSRAAASVRDSVSVSRSPRTVIMLSP